MAAIPPPAGAVPPPVAVTLPGGNATPDLDIHLDPTDLFVVACPCLGWDFHAPAGGAIGAGTASIPHYKAVRSFAARCTIGDNPANKAAAAQCSPVVFALDAAAWSLILTELRDSDLFEHGPFTRLRDLDDAIDGLMIQNPANLVLLPASYLPGLETFDTPAVAAVAAIPGRGRGRGRGRGVPAVPAVPAVPGPPELQFLNMTSLLKFFETADGNPMRAFTRLVGALGPCGTRAVRADMLSQVQTVASTIRPQIAKAGGFTLSANPATQLREDAVLSSTLCKYVSNAYESLTPTLALDVASAGGFQSEIQDAFIFLTGTEENKSAVLSRRLTFIDDRFSPLPPADALISH